MELLTLLLTIALLPDQNCLVVTHLLDGFRLQILNDNVIKLDTARSGFFNITGTEGILTFGILRDNNNPQNNGLTLPNDYTIEFYPEVADTSIEFRLFPPNFPINFFPATPVPFKVKNLTQNRYIDFFYRKSGTVSTTYSIYFRDLIDSTFRNTWKADLFYAGANSPLPTAGTLDLYTQNRLAGMIL